MLYDTCTVLDIIQYITQLLKYSLYVNLLVRRALCVCIIVRFVCATFLDLHVTYYPIAIPTCRIPAVYAV